MDWLIFDCDGVLVDSERIAQRVLVERLSARLGRDVEDVEAEVIGLLGHHTEEILRGFEARAGVVFEPDFVPGVIAATRAALVAELTAIEGVAWALPRIALPKAVVSNSDRPHVEWALELAAIEAEFGGRLFTAERVERPKPAPDLYLLAARELGVDPARCLVVEDSVAGITAAVAAGMTVIGFTGGGHLPPDHADVQLALGAHVSIDDMHALPALVERLLARPPG